nr:acetolactate synthase small subunit [Ishige okamurae]
MKSIIRVLVEQESGALVRIVGLISRRRFKLESFSIGSCERKNLARLTIVMTDESTDRNKSIQLTKQLKKIINVLEVKDVTSIPIIERELTLIKLKVTNLEKEEVISLSKVFNFRIIDISHYTLSLEISSSSEKLFALEKLLHKYKVIEFTKTGKITLIRESSNNTLSSKSDLTSKLPISLTDMQSHLKENKKQVPKSHTKRIRDYTRILNEHQENKIIRPRQFEKKRYAYLWR